MKIVLVGYGKMGKMCETLAAKRGHTVTAVATKATSLAELDKVVLQADMIIDFSHPEAAVDTILLATKHKKNIVVGTTGWYHRIPEITPKIMSAQIGCLYSPNFSLGVALFNTLVSHGAKLFAPQLGYDVALQEIHHKAKVDAPSGTAKRLAETIEKAHHSKDLPIASVRVGTVPGTHTVLFDSPNDTITLTHAANNRAGFAEGALIAAEWLQGKTGLFTFDDFFTSRLKELP